MTEKQPHFTHNARLVLIADFFWNFARCLPHAILTIYLLDKGVSLLQIATIQTCYMVVSMTMEFPSGVLSDMFSRKFIYELSVVVIFISYFLIGFFAEHFFILCIAYILYGFSIALKSGTLEAEVVIEFRNLGSDIKYFSVASNYIMSVSALVAGFLGSFLYSVLKNKMYIISSFSFCLSFLIALLSYRKNHNNRYLKKDEKSAEDETSKKGFFEEIKLGFKLLYENNALPFVILISSLTALFLQPFFQYWQVLYKECNFPIKYFGSLYLVFQFCNIVASFLFKRLGNSVLIQVGILLCIPLLFLGGISLGSGIVFVFPIVICLFYIYNLYLDVLIKNASPNVFISTFFSLINTISNFTSIVSLLFMAFLIEHIGIKNAYLVMFFIFTFSSVAVLLKNKKHFAHIT